MWTTLYASIRVAGSGMSNVASTVVILFCATLQRRAQLERAEDRTANARARAPAGAAQRVTDLASAYHQLSRHQGWNKDQRALRRQNNSKGTSSSLTIDDTGSGTQFALPSMQIYNEP